MLPVGEHIFEMARLGNTQNLMLILRLTSGETRWTAASRQLTPKETWARGNGLTTVDTLTQECSKAQTRALLDLAHCNPSKSQEKLSPEKLTALLDAGISVAAINYRFVTTDPLPTAHHDAKRAIQVMRSKASEWNIDKERVAAFGGSAGAQICMWLAYSDDMADAASDDPVERESTRLVCVATAGGQTSNQREFYAAHILPLLGGEATIESLIAPLGGKSDPEEVLMKMWGGSTPEEASETAKQCSALQLISADDPPIFMSYGMSPDAEKPSDKRRLRGWLIHHVVFGTELKEKADQLGVEADLRYPGGDSRHSSEVAFFCDKLLSAN